MKEVYDLRVWIEFLESLGLVRIRTDSSHTYWDYPKGHKKRLKRLVTVREEYKEVPRRHIQTSLQNLELPNNHFEKWLNAKQKGRGKKKKVVTEKSAETFAQALTRSELDSPKIDTPHTDSSQV